MKTKATTNPLDRLGSGGVEDYLSGQPERYVPSGVRELDNLVLGAVAGELTLVAGAPGQGKTSLAIQWLLDNAQNGGSSAILSLEMSKRALRNRIVSGLTGIDMRVLRTREWPSEKHRKSALQAVEYLADIPLYVDDRGGLDADAVYEALTAWPKQGVTLGVVDYVQQMSGTNESRVTQVGDAVRAIKSAAKDGDFPIIAVSAINRSAANADNRKPKLSDMRDSGDLEFVADTVLMFHYPEDDLYEDIRQVDIHVMKQRNGPTGVASVQFNKPATRFEERKDV